MKNLNEVRNFLDNKIHSINAGGCSISALAMYRWLMVNNKLKGDEYIVYGYHAQSCGYHVNEEALNNKELRPSSCSHAFLHHDGKFFDSYNETSPNKYRYKHFISDFDFILRSINEPNWNDWFERSQVDKIQHELKIDLSDIKIHF